MPPRLHDQHQHCERGVVHSAAESCPLTRISASLSHHDYLEDEIPAEIQLDIVTEAVARPPSRRVSRLDFSQPLQIPRIGFNESL